MWSGPVLFKVFVYKITVNKLLCVFTSDQKNSFFIGFILFTKTVNRGDHRKVPNNENGNIWKNARKRVKLLKLRAEKCLKVEHNMFFKTSNLL